MSLLKVAWNVLRIKNMHFESPSDPLGPWGKAKPSYIHYVIGRDEAELRISKLTLVPGVSPKQLCVLAHLGCTREADTS